MTVTMNSKRYIAADLFCGAGGLSVGFKEAGFDILFANELNDEFRQTYEYNHPGTVYFPGSIEGLTFKKIHKRTGIGRGELDVLIGGPPCQGFSINAPKRSVEDSRNHLFKHYARLVLDGLHPKVILMENVPGLVSLDNGRFLKAIYELFGNAGYSLKHMFLCAAHYGVPQERWRLILIGTSLDAEISFPKPKYSAPVRANFTGGRDYTWLPLFKNGALKSLKPFINIKDAIGDLPYLTINEGVEESSYNGPPATLYQKHMRKGSKILYNHVSGNLSKVNLERIKHVPPGGSWRDIPYDLLPDGMKLARRSDHTKRYGRLNPLGLSGTVLTKCDPHWGSFFHYEQDRTITVREAARLQSFPDKFRFFGNKVSQYVQVGNAVPPLLAHAIALHIKTTFFR